MSKNYNFFKFKSYFLIVSLLFFSNAFSANWYVNNNSITGDIYCSAIGSASGTGSISNPFLTLNAALTAASNGDTIYVDAGSYTGVGNKSLLLNKSINIIGSGSNSTIFTSHTNDRFATISVNNVHIQGIQLFDFFLAGTTGIGQVILVNTNITGFELTNVVVKNNYGDSSNGESIYLSSGSSSTFNGLFFSCSGFNGSSGGAVKIDNATLVLKNSVFSQSRNSDGFGGAIQMLGTNPNVNIDKTTFIGNSAKSGGAISQIKGTLIVTNSCFNRNYCQGDSSGTTNGGGHYYSTGTITSASFTNCKFEGAFFCASSNPTEYPCQFSSNVSNDGNAISIRGAAGNFTFDTCDFNNSNQPNANFDNGLDFYLDKAGVISVNITNCKFANDMWGGTGTGGNDAVNIWNEDLTSAEFIVTNSGIKQTTANQDGTYGNNYSYALNTGGAPTGNDLTQSSTTTVTCISGFAGCTTVVNCATETNAPIIISCAPDQTLSSCSGTLPDYRPLLSVFDDCSVTIVQSPVPGTLLSSLGNGTHTITFTVSDQSPNSPDATCTMILTLSGCNSCSAALSYPISSVCKSASTLIPTFSPVGGAFASTSGLTINTSTGVVTPSTSTAGTYIITYTPDVAIPSCTATFSITIVDDPNAGTNGTLTICAGTTVTASQLFAALGGSPASSGTWYPALAGAGTYTYTVAATSPCTTAATATVTVIAQAQPNAGSNGTLTICAGTTVTASQLFAVLGGSPASGGTWTPTLAGVGTYTYSVAATSPCTTAATATVTVTAQAKPNAGSNGTLTICDGTTVTASQLFAALGGSPATGGTWSPALAGVGIYTYSVEATSPCTTAATSTVTVTAQAQPNAGTNGTLTICAGTTVTASQLFAALGGAPASGGTWSPALAGTGTYTYTVAATSPCTTAATSTVTVIAQAQPNAGSNGTLTICAGTTVTASQLFAALGGSPASGGTWTPTLAGAGTYTYSVAATSPCTTAATATVTVTAQAQPNAGSNGTLTICAGTTVTASQLFAALGGSPATGGTWIPTLAGAGTYTYSVAATSPCTTPVTATITVSDSQPAQPTLACYQTATFNTATCLWIVTGTQPTQPTATNCWDNYQFNTTSCSWVNNGSQPAQPTATNCWDNYQFNTTLCTWVNIGTQPTQPTATNCWDNYQFNTTSCSWVNNGSQPAQPTLACYQTATFNTATCLWIVTGTQPTQPTATNCWDNYQFNTTSCSWVNIGSQPAQPTATNCWDNYQFNTTSCSWVNNGSQPAQPTATNCWDNYQFNTTLCTWVNIGTQPTQPTATNCWDNYQFNTTSCSWVNNGSQPAQPTATNCWDNYQFNTTLCTWVNNGTQPTQPTATNCWDNYQFNTTSCSWVNNGTQPTQPTATNCWDNYQFNTTSCSWVNNGSQPAQPTATNCWDNYQFNTTSCTWVNIGLQPTQPLIAVNNAICNGSTYSVTFNTNGTITASTGTISGNTISGIVVGTNVVLTATSSNGCTASTTMVVTSPASCTNPPTNCVVPTLSTGQGTCSGTGTYSFAFNTSAGAVITVNSGTISGNTVTGIALGTNVTITAANGLCVTSMVVNSPIDCSSPCAIPMASFSAGICNGSTYNINISNPNNASITASLGNVTTTSINNIPVGTNVNITAQILGCSAQIITITSPQLAVTPFAGNDGNIAICENVTPTSTELFNALGGTPHTGGFWSNTGNVYTYTVQANSTCSSIPFDTATVTINEIIINNFAIIGECVNEIYQLSVSPIQNGVTYNWYDSTDTLLGIGTSIIINDNGTYHVESNLNNCKKIAVITVDNSNCIIPKGISPNDDGLNDSWNLSNLKVEKAQIFNRYGMEIFSKLNYTSEWHGQTNSGHLLPSATYYYVLTLPNGKVRTGWVYLNREN
jgi:gliding motility-associated-like protein